MRSWRYRRILAVTRTSQNARQGVLIPMNAKSLLPTVLAVATSVCAIAPAAAQNASSIGALSAVVEKVSPTGAAVTASFRISVTGPDGNSIKAFDNGALGKPNVGEPRGSFTISVRLCDKFPANIGTQCKWSN